MTAAALEGRALSRPFRAAATERGPPRASVILHLALRVPHLTAHRPGGRGPLSQHLLQAVEALVDVVHAHGEAQADAVVGAEG